MSTYPSSDSTASRLHECVIKNINDTNVLEAALIENIQREDLNVIEEANAYKGLIDIKGINKDLLAHYRTWPKAQGTEP